MQFVTLSAAQERLVFVDSSIENKSLFNIPLAIKITGKLDTKLLKLAFFNLILRQKILNLKIYNFEGEIKGKILKTPYFKLKSTKNFKNKNQNYIEEFIEDALAKDFKEQDLIRAELLHYKKDEYILVIVIHHIISDDWSMDILLRELSHLYNSLKKNIPNELPFLKIQYHQFAKNQKELIQRQYYEETLNYWQEYLEGHSNFINLPSTKARPNVLSNKGEGIITKIPEAIYKKIKSYCRIKRVTIFTFLITAFQFLLHRYSSEDDIVIGYPSANRLDPDLEHLIGLFVNILPLRTKFEGNKSFYELIEQTKFDLINGYENQDFPFEQLVQNLGINRTPNYHPIFQILFTFINNDSYYDFSDLTISILDIKAKLAKFDLSLFCNEKNNELSINFLYSTDILEKSTVEILSTTYLNIINNVLENDTMLISKIPLVDSEFPTNIIENNIQEESIISLFEQQVLKNPEKTAIIFKNQKYNYRELANLANSFASYLKKSDIDQGTIIAINIEPSVEFISIIIGTIKYGCIFLPIDKMTPPERILNIINESDASLFIASNLDSNYIKKYDGRILDIAIDYDYVFNTKEFLSTNNKQDEICCIIYTSGSSGTPKGVLCKHISIINRVKWHSKKYKIKNNDIFILLANLSFVDSIGEIFLPLLNGSTLVIPPAKTAADPEQLISYINKYSITRIGIVPSLLRILFEKYKNLNLEIPSIMHMEVSGEPFHYDLIKQTLNELKKVKLINRYGSTEATSVIYNELRINPNSEESFLIKTHVIDNAEIHILDKYLNHVPKGLIGDVYVSGVPLADGYLKSPDLTEEKFINNFNNPLLPQKIYKTGDLGIFNQDGSIQIMGRKDNQVKINGYRVELREIELAIERYSEINQAIVTYDIIDDEQKKLIAFITLKNVENLSGTTYSENILRELLSNSLPQYMIPTKFIILDHIPLSNNGKINYQALKNSSDLVKKEYNIAPRNHREYKIAKIWEEVLKIDKVGIFDDFFQIGGNSLIAIRLIVRIQKTFGISFPIPNIYKYKTVEAMAKIIAQDNSFPNEGVILPINKNGTEIPIFLIHPAPGFAFPYSILSKHLKNYPIYGINDASLSNPDLSFKTIQEMASFYLQKIIEVQKNGPYILGGWSFGGAVALEIAYQLKAINQEVDTIIMFDSSHRPKEYYNEWTDQEIAEDLHRIGLNHDSNEGKIIIEIMKRNGGLLKNYIPSNYVGRVILFKAQNDEYTSEFRRNDFFQGWSKVLGRNLEIYSVKSTHKDMFNEEHVQELSILLEYLITNKNINYILQDQNLSNIDAYLHYAINQNDQFSIDRLLNIGACMSSKDSFGKTASDKKLLTSKHSIPSGTEG